MLLVVLHGAACDAAVCCMVLLVLSGAECPWMLLCAAWCSV